MAGLYGVESAGNIYKRSQLEDVTFFHSPRLTVTIESAGAVRECSRGEVLCLNEGIAGGYAHIPLTSSAPYTAKCIVEEPVTLSTSGEVQTIALFGPARIFESDVIYPTGISDDDKNKVKKELRDNCIYLSASDYIF